MPITADLSAALERQEGKEQIYYNPTPSMADAQGAPYFALICGGASAADDFVHILRALPEVITDHVATLEIVTKLLGVVAQQQMQINELSERVESLARASVALKAQENIHEVLTRLTAQGSNVVKPEVTIRMTAVTSDHASQETSAQSSASSSQSRSVGVKADLCGLLDVLSGLRLAVDGKQSDARMKVEQMAAQTAMSQDRLYHGDVVIKFESISGNPIVQAQAEAIRKGVRPVPEMAKAPTDAVIPKDGPSSR